MRLPVIVILLLSFFTVFPASGQVVETIQQKLSRVYNETKYETELTVAFAIVGPLPGSGDSSQRHPKDSSDVKPPPPDSANKKTRDKTTPPIVNENKDGEQDDPRTTPPISDEKESGFLPSDPLMVMIYLLVSVAIIILILVPVLLLLKLVPVKQLKIGDEQNKENEEEQDELSLKTKPVLQEVNDLISKGKLAEAIQLMLHSIVDEICLNIDTRITYSNTTREIIKKARMSNEMRKEVVTLAGTGEKVIFGKQKPDMPMIHYCIASYKSFYQLYYGDNTTV